jgi:hypothetical protein
MLTLYVRKLAALCVLVLIMPYTPAVAEVTTLGGGSGGMAEVQNRLTGGIPRDRSRQAAPIKCDRSKSRCE